MVDDFVFGHALREAASEQFVDTDVAAAQLATGTFPRLAEVFGRGRIEIDKDRFQVGLRLLLEEYGPQRRHLSPKPKGSSSGRGGKSRE